MLRDTIYAHSRPGQPVSSWESLKAHSDDVAGLAGRFGSRFGWGALTAVAGRLHDVGKASDTFQSYLLGDCVSGGDHSTAGALIAHERYGAHAGGFLARIIISHHSGLSDGEEFARRMVKTLDWASGRYEAFLVDLPTLSDLAPSRPFDSEGSRGFAAQFVLRMGFSCLVDADYLATEAFYAGGSRHDDFGPHRSIIELKERFDRSMQSVASKAPDLPINQIRAEIGEHALAKADLPPGHFTLTVPTGGGKTLASLGFALHHAACRDLRRVIIVIPYTSIIEQTADVVRRVLTSDGDVLEHHSNVEELAGLKPLANDEARLAAANRLCRAAENWDVPIVVTTAVQFFESLFASRPSRCRKLHNIAGSVIVLDEIQTLPLHLLLPSLAALDQLARNYHCSVVLSTATQPALRAMDGALRRRDGRSLGLVIGAERELAPRPDELFADLKRTEVACLAEPVGDEVVADQLVRCPQILVIVNDRQHAQDLFRAIAALPGAFHLSTLMCARHRRAVLALIKQRLKAGEPVRLVSTSLIEAGVDISFPVVWRAAAGLDSIAQAAGRCNREGELRDADGKPVLGQVVVFKPAKHPLPHDIKLRWQASEPVLLGSSDPLAPEAIAAYYRELYWQQGDAEAAFDAAFVGPRRGILPAIAERASSMAFPYRSIDEAYRLVDEKARLLWCPGGRGMTVRRSQRFSSTGSRAPLSPIAAIFVSCRAMS